MQNPGQAVTELARQQSACGRILGRSKGIPMPFSVQGPVQNSESGQGWTMLHDHKMRWEGNIVVSLGFPIAAAMGTCIFICRRLL